MTNILITGNQGYIGTILSEELYNLGYNIFGYDIGYYEDGFTNCASQKYIHTQKQKDIRNINQNDLKNIDIVIHLAALSNDPLGEFNQSLTNDINYKAALKTAIISKNSGVKKFIYISSQSMYGVSDSDDELDEENSIKNPVTTYAKTKWEAEKELRLMNTENFIVTMLRPSTVFGASNRLRCDIVFNNLMASAYSTGKIQILSDGSPWRPVIHVKDLSNAIIACINAPYNLIGGEAFNVGIPNGNYTVKDLAEAVKVVVPKADIIFKNEHTDPRTYKVSFKKILNQLKDYYKPKWNLVDGGYELLEFFDKNKFNEEEFKHENYNRLKKLRALTDKKLLDNNLYWKKN